jgi:cytochrome b involved in lipid metabolism
MKIVSEEELKLHNKKDDLWVAVNGYVYDVTNFLSKHPGTEKPLLYFAGIDASDGFNKKHPNVDISEVKEVVLIGEFAVNVD